MHCDRLPETAPLQLMQSHATFQATVRCPCCHSPASCDVSYMCTHCMLSLGKAYSLSHVLPAISATIQLLSYHLLDLGGLPLARLALHTLHSQPFLLLLGCFSCTACFLHCRPSSLSHSDAYVQYAEHPLW